MSKRDKICVAMLNLLILLYSFISFKNLGSNVNPQTFYNYYKASETAFELERGVNYSRIRCFGGNKELDFSIYASEDGETFNKVGDAKISAFEWEDSFINISHKYIKIIANSNGLLGEIVVYDEMGNKVNAKPMYSGYENLVDEPNTVPNQISYMNSTYFDEIYFATSAYEFANGMPATEWTHPHLGKIIQSIPIFFLGITPFAYRLMGNIAGIIMIIIMYILGNKLFKNPQYGLLAAFLMTFDNFHFAQTRMGTVDSFLVLFGMISTIFMYNYFIADAKTQFKKKIINLFLCGIFWGMAISVKWTAAYFGLGFSILFFGKMIYDTIRERKFDKKNILIIISCIVFFIVIPCAIYITCYLNFTTVHSKTDSLSKIIAINKDMYKFHSTLKSHHPYSSTWYTWPIMLQPVWYYITYINTNLCSTIAGIGNPAIWWIGIIALIFVLIVAIRKRKKEDIFIITMFITVWLPYMVIGREMFMYHYFIALPFVMLATVRLIKALRERYKARYIIWLYMLLVFMLFVAFYPIVSGALTYRVYIDSMKWLNTWVF